MAEAQYLKGSEQLLSLYKICHDFNDSRASSFLYTVIFIYIYIYDNGSSVPQGV